MATTAQQVAELQKQNNEMYIQSAREQMSFQREMSNTAHQREVADYIKAGLNPVLSATGGQGATTPNGAQADVDTSSMVNYLLNEMNNENARQINNAQVSAQRYAAEMSYKASQALANAQITVAQIQADTKPWYSVMSALSGENNVVSKAIKTVAGMFGFQVSWSADGISITPSGKPKQDEKTILGWLKTHWDRAMSLTPSYSEYANAVKKNLEQNHYYSALNWMNWWLSNKKPNK